MFVVIFHMLYLLGRYVYDNCRSTRASMPSNDGTEEKAADDSSDDGKVEAADDVAPPMETGMTITFRPPAYIQRYHAVLDVLGGFKYGGKLRKVVDFGCSEINFLCYMKRLEGVEEILLVDIDEGVLQQCKTRASPLVSEYLCQRTTKLTVEICQGSVTDNDKRLENTDAVVCIELIEHLYDPVLMNVPANIFGYIKPKVAVITTPNADFNVLFSNFNGFRHPDHKFEWTRREFENWAEDIVRKYPNYSVSFQAICYGPKGTEHLGGCTQMAIFELNQESCVIDPEVVGIEGKFRTIEKYIYPVLQDDRSDTQKVLDEVTYYVSFVMHIIKNEEPPKNREVDLIYLHSFMTKYPLSLESLRNIMTENGYVIEDRESGPPVVIIPEESDTETDEMDDYTPDYDIDDNLSEDEEQLGEIYISEGATYENGWNEESIIITENQTVTNHENSYLFDGEHLTDHHHSPEEWDADAYATGISTPDATDVSTMFSNGGEPIYEEILPSDRDPCASNAIEANNVTEADDSITTLDITSSSLPTISQNVSTNLSSLQADTISSFQPYLSVSRSSTSPGLLFSAELDDSLISQNLLNSTFHRSEVPNEAITAVKLPAEASSINKALPLEKKGEIDLSERTSLSYLKGHSNNIEQNNIDSMKYQVLGDTPNHREIETEVQNVFSVVYDKPQSTSSPRCNKLRTTHVENQIVSTEENSHLSDGEHSTSLRRSSEELAVVQDVDVRFPKCSNREESITVKQSCLEGDDLISALKSYTELMPVESVNAVTSETLKDISQRSLHSDRIITETINCQATSGNKNATSKRATNANCSLSNNSQQELCLSSEIVDSDHFTCVDSPREDINGETAGGENLIKHETDITNVQRVDTCCVLSSNDVHEEYACSKSKAAAIKKACDDETRTRLQNGSTVPAHPSISGKSLSPFREFVDTKSRSGNECSFSARAKDSNGSDDSFKSCDEDTINKIVQFAPPLRGDENVGCDTRDSTSKDVNTSSVAGLIAGAEAKLPSPAFESPPDSWSHEIVDSGYPNSASGQDITPENDLSSIAQDHIPDTESPSVAEAPRLGVLEPVEVENGDLANNNRDDEGNNMMAADAANDIEGLQPFIDVLENDLENENDIYALENGFPMWLLRILDMANPLDFDAQPQQNLRIHHEVADVDYMDHDEGFDSSSSDE